MSSIDPSEYAPLEPYIPPKESQEEIRESHPVHTHDSLEHHSYSDHHDKTHKSSRKEPTKDDADAALKKLQYLKHMAKTLPAGKIPSELKTLIKTEKKIETARVKNAIIVDKAIKMNADLDTYYQAMQKAVDTLNQAIKDYNNSAPSSSTTMLKSAIDAYQQAAAEASKSYAKAAGIFNAIVKTVPAINAQLAALGLPKISPIPQAVPPPLSTSSGPYAPPSVSQPAPITPLPAVRPFARIPSISPPPSEAQAIDLALGSAIMTLFNSMSQPMNIQKHIERQV